MRKLLFAAALAAAGIASTATATDGALDASFLTDANFPGYGFYANPNGGPNNTLDSVGAIVPTQDGKIWVVGRMKAGPGAYRLSLYRVLSNGYPDVDFGDLGLRTVVAPCADFVVGDATLDAQGRLVVAIDRCTDFMAYRFLPNGDLDTNLAGSGVLTVPFDKGGDNVDTTQHVATMPNGNIVLAGTVSTATIDNLGIAYYTAAGQPVPGFGTAGKLSLSFEWSVADVFGVNGLHITSDGRIVVAGQITETSQAVSDKKQFVVRVLSSGGMDPSFGNVSAGLSKVNQKAALGVSESPWTYASLLENDGSVIQVGKVRSNAVNSSGDFYLMRWRPDGQLDTSIGAHGVRQYALDFAGPNPAEPDDNYEAAKAIARQANGDYLIMGSSAMGGYAATAVVRLKRNFNLDSSFGNGGKIQHLAQVSTTGDHGQYGVGILQEAGRLVVGGAVYTGFNGRMQMMFAMQHDEIFAHTFD